MRINRIGHASAGDFEPRGSAARDLFAKCAAYTDPEALRRSGLYPYFRVIEESTGPTVQVSGRRYIMMGSNNYLGLTHHPRVIEKAQQALARLGTGCTGSRLLSGHLALHAELEEALCRFLGRPACLVFSTGFSANHGALEALLGRDDVVFSDKENHASLLQGLRSGLAKLFRYPHMDVSALESLLHQHRNTCAGAMIVSDGVFSMTGEMADVQALCDLAHRYDCKLFIDDAHGIGVVGSGGRGVCFQNHDAHHAVDLISGTFSKSLASIGGFIVGPAPVVDFIRHRSRPFIFTAALPPAAAATALECLKIIHEEPERLEVLSRHGAYLRHEMALTGFKTFEGSTPIVPLFMGEEEKAYRFISALFQEGVFATPVVYPAVARGQAMIRMSVMATHTKDQLQRVIEASRRAGKSVGVLS